MQLGLVSLLSAATLLLTPRVLAVDIKFHSQNYCYGSPVWTVRNAASNKCYSSYEASSIDFGEIPYPAKGQGYVVAGNLCRNYGGEVTTGCLYRSGSGSYFSANWFEPYKKLARKDESAIMEPERFTVTYELPDATTREIEVPEEHFERAVKFLKEKDYEALSVYPLVSSLPLAFTHLNL